MLTLDQARFELQVRWQYSFRRRAARADAVAGRLPWPVWCQLCAWDATSVVKELGRRSDRPLRFVQIGSNDGVANDPLHESVERHGWTGLLVEPLPHLFNQLTANYSGVRGLEFANVAIGAETGTTTIYTVAVRSSDPDWASQIASLDRDVVLRHSYELVDLDQRIVPVEVECLTLASLVDRYGLARIDLLHIDAEGFDADIVEQIELGEPWAPRYLIFEKKHLGRDRYLGLRRRLMGAGYRFVNLWPDELAYRRSGGQR